MLILLSAGLGEDLPRRYDPLLEITRPYAYSIAHWELSNFFDKWLYEAKHLFNGQSDTEQKRVVARYFDVAGEMRRLDEEQGPLQAGGDTSALDETRARRASLERDRSSIEDGAEQAMEDSLGDVLKAQGLETAFGWRWKVRFIFPPVDFKFARPPSVLIVSPRDRIEVARKLWLRPGIPVEEREEIERKVEALGYSALIEDVGGFSSYPSIVPETARLDRVARTAAHEWLHSYFFFRPLGRNYDDSYDMAIMNETAADLAAEELGGIVAGRFTGAAEASSRPQATATADSDGDSFDYGRELRRIRVTLDAYLTVGDVEGAEAYMSGQRAYLAAHGHYLRKLNQAYFAFHGTYADTPAGISPIAGQLEELRRQAATVGGFVRAVAGISSADELAERLAGAQ